MKEWRKPEYPEKPHDDEPLTEQAVACIDCTAPPSQLFVGWLLNVPATG